MNTRRACCRGFSARRHSHSSPIRRTTAGARRTMPVAKNSDAPTDKPTPVPRPDRCTASSSASDRGVPVQAKVKRAGWASTNSIAWAKAAGCSA